MRNLTTHTIQLTYDMVDHIMIEELKGIYKRNLIPNTDEGGWPLDVDEEVLNAVDVLLAYIMPPSEYEEWKNGTRTPVGKT